MKAKLTALAVLTVQVLLPNSKTPNEPIRVSAWYWLNSAPRQEWAADFHNMKHLGFTHLSLCWGLDLTAWRFRVEDTKYALNLARQSGLGAYLIVWHPSHNSLPRRPEFQQIDAGGNVRFTFDTFNTTWRNTQWKEYLQTVAKLYAGHPAFAGYIFDDTFGIGGIGTIDGPMGKPEQLYVSYSAFDGRLFGKQPPKSPADLGWSEWTAARSDWWANWSQDTIRFIREIDQNIQHEIYLEDNIDSIFQPRVRDRIGLDFGKAAQPWDAVGAYTEPDWGMNSHSAQAQIDFTRAVIGKVRAAVGPEKKIIYTFWAGNAKELRTLGPAKYPMASQIRDVCEAALSLGIRHLDMYGYRIGDFVVTEKDWPQKRPPLEGPYRLTDPFPQKYLYDRTSLHEELGAYLRSLHDR